MKIDNVYIALIRVVTSNTIDTIDDYCLINNSVGQKLKHALVYVKKRDFGGYEYRDLETGLKYKTSNKVLKTGNLYVDLKSLIPYRQFLYEIQKENNNLKINDNMAKRKMLKLFYKSQNGGKSENR